MGGNFLVIRSTFLRIHCLVSWQSWRCNGDDWKVVLVSRGVYSGVSDMVRWSWEAVYAP